MKKWTFLFVLAWSCIFVNAQNWSKPGSAVSYNAEGNAVTFQSSSGAKLALKLCNEGVVKIWYSPSGTFKRTNESFAVVNEALGGSGNIAIEDQPSAYELFTPKLRIRINKNPFQLQIFDKYQKLLLSDYKDMGHVHDSSKKVAYKTLRYDEQFFGLGEKGGPINRRGRAYKMWNSDKPCYGVNEDPLYKSIPFFLSSYKYGIFFDNTYKTEFKFGTESNDYYSFEAPDGEMIYYFIFGNDFKEIIEQYTVLTGKPIMPPKWALGFSQSRGMLTNETLTRNLAAEFRKRKIPCDIIYQDIGWVSALQSFDWHKKRYSNPRGMLRSLDSLGFKVIVSQDPVISQANQMQWKEADSLHFFTTDIRTGKTYDMPWPWGGNCGVVDFTKPEVADWWGRYQQKPINDGVKGFWTDMGEPAWSNEDAIDRLNMKHHLGMHNVIHNVYGLTWDKVVKEQFEKHNPDKRVFQMTRSAYAGMQRYTFGWSGDAGNGNNVLDGWNQMANQIPLSLSAGMGLIPFWATDISGYCGDIKDYPAMTELYVRWMQFGLFNPLSRAHHEGNNAVEPWLFGEEAEKICKSAIELKYRLFPYIYTYAREAHDKGLPLMRALFLEYPNDEKAYNENGAFLFGKELLIAPVVKKGAITKQVYLPEGQWIDFKDGKTVYEGEQTITYPAPLDVTPVFVKKGSIVPMMPVMQYLHQKKVYPIRFEIFPANVNGQASFELYEDDGETLAYQKDVFAKTTINCQTGANGYDITTAKAENAYQLVGKRNFVLRLHVPAKPRSVIVNDKKINLIDNSRLTANEEKSSSTQFWSWDAKAGVCSVLLPDTGSANRIRITK
jgi:alpha-glucosidase